MGDPEAAVPGVVALLEGEAVVASADVATEATYVIEDEATDAADEAAEAPDEALVENAEAEEEALLTPGTWTGTPACLQVPSTAAMVSACWAAGQER